MRKIFTLLLGIFTLVLVSCQQEELGSNTSEAAIKITARIPQQEPLTRASGNGEQINRCILEVYRGEELYTRQIQSVNGLTTNFELRLVSSQTYNFVFWADNGTGTDNQDDNHYITTNGLTAIAFKANDYAGNDDTRDAFFSKEEITVEGAFTKTITLKRPFAQINVKTTDLAAIPSENLKPDKITTAFAAIPTLFNALSGEPGNETALTYTAPVVDDQGNLSMDYVFAPTTEKNLIDFSMTFYNGDQKITTNDAFKAIPVQRNYRTNISGNLLTKPGKIDVKVDPGFTDPDIERQIVEVSSVAEANTALANGAQGVVITEAPTTEGTILIPYNYTTNNNEVISITLPEKVEQQITITYGEQSKEAPASIQVVAPNTEKLIIDTPKSTVTLNGKVYKVVEATTAENTLVIEKDVVIETLTIKQGNIKIYGTVKNVVKDDNYTGTIYRCIDSEESLTNLMNDNTSGYTEILIERPVTGLNGGGKTLGRPVTVAADAEISNLIIDSPQGNGISLGADNIAVTLDGLTIYQNANDVNNGLNCAILAANHNNLKLTVRNSHLIVPKSGQRGINIHSSNDPFSVCTIILDNTHIGPQLDIIGENDYNTSQNEIFKKCSDLRGISIASHEGNVLVKLQNNSIIEGVFYAINSVQHHDNFEVQVNDSRLDGRCAFNIWSDGNASFKVENSKLIGRNPFGGPTEVFATIVVNGSDASWSGAANNLISIHNSEIYCYNNPETDTNIQYAIDLRSKLKNTLQLSGNTCIYDKSASKRLPHAVNVESWINDITVASSVSLDGNEQATILPSPIWDGKLTSLSPSNDGKYYIGTPQELAYWVEKRLGGYAVLVRDLNLNHLSWPVNTESEIKGTFDGANHTIHNLNCKTYLVEADGNSGLAWDNKKQNAGLFGVFGGTLKNIKIDGAEIYGSRSGALVGRYTGGLIDNCHLTNIKVTGGAQKMGAFIGFIASNTTSTVISNCSLKNSSVTKDPNPAVDDASCMAGGFIGYLQAFGQDVTIENNLLENVTVESGNKWDLENECASHVFIGDIINLSKATKATIEIQGNTIRNSELTNAQTTDLATDYFGFYYKVPTDVYPVVSKIIVNGKTLVE